MASVLEPRTGACQVLFFDFVQNDSKLLIVIKEEKYNDDTSTIVDLVVLIIVLKESIHFRSFLQKMNIIKDWLVLLGILSLLQKTEI